MSELLDAAQVAERWGVSVSIVHDLAATGELGHVWVRRSRRFSPSDLADYLERHKVRPAHDNRPRQPRRWADDIDVGAELERQFGGKV